MAQNLLRCIIARGLSRDTYVYAPSSNGVIHDVQSSLVLPIQLLRDVDVHHASVFPHHVRELVAVLGVHQLTNSHLQHHQPVIIIAIIIRPFHIGN